MPPFSRTLALLLATLCLSGCTHRTSSEPILIGHVVALSGPNKAAGEHAKQGVALAVEEVNQDENRIAGRMVEVLHADTRGEPEMVQNEAVRLITVNRVTALLGGGDPEQAERLARTAQPYAIPVVLASGLVASGGNENVFALGLTPAYQGQVLAQVAAHQLKTTRVAVLADSRPASTALVAAFGTEFPSGKDVLVKERSYKSDAEFAGLVAPLKEERMGAILFAGPARDFLKLRTQLRSAGLEVPILFGGEEGSLSLLQQEPATKQAVYLVTAFTADAGPAAGQAFTKKYRERFGQEPDVHAALAYDAARFLFEGMRQTNSAEGVKVRKTLAGLESFEGVTGPVALEKGQVARRPVYVVRLADGKTVVHRYEAKK